MSCALMSFAFISGIGVWPTDTGPLAQLTSDERCYAENVIHQLDACEDERCRALVSRNFREVINLRRRLQANRGGDVLFNALRAPCEELTDNIDQQRACFASRVELPFDEAMKLAGFSQAGVTASGNSQLRTGMRMSEVEFILGGPGEEVSYASSDGYSAATYRWVRGRRVIIVSFSDDELSGRSQSGL